MLFLKLVKLCKCIISLNVIYIAGYYFIFLYSESSIFMHMKQYLCLHQNCMDCVQTAQNVEVVMATDVSVFAFILTCEQTFSI